MRRMVGCHHVDESVGQCLAQGGTIFWCLDRWVALDTCAQRVVVFSREHQVGNDCLSGDLLLLDGLVLKQLQFLGCRDVGDVQTRTSVFGHLHSQRRRLIAGFHTADARVVAYREVVLTLIFLLECSDIGFDDASVLAMCHQQEGRGGEDAIEGFSTIHQHIARAAAHEHLHPWHTCAIKDRQGLHIVVGGSKIEGVVHTTVSCRNLELLFQQVECRGGRIGVGHLHIGRHASCGSRTTFAGNVSLVGHAWLTEMHVVINHTREQV